MLVVAQGHRGIVVLVLLALVLLGGAAAADPVAPVQANLRTHGPVTFEGAMSTGSTDVTLVIGPPATTYTGDTDHGTPVLTLSGAQGTLRILRASRTVANNPLGGDVAPTEPEFTNEVRQLQGATLSVLSPQEGFLALLTPLAQADLRLDVAGGACRWATDPESHAYVAGGDSFPAPYYYSRQVPEDSLRFSCAAPYNPLIRAAAGLQIVLDRATLVFGDGDGAHTVLLGRLEETQTGALGQPFLSWHNATFAVLTLDRAQILLAQGAGIAFHAQEPGVALEGRLVVPAATGSVVLGAEGAGARAKTVVLEGHLQVRIAAEAASQGLLPGPSASGGTRVRVGGEATRAMVGGVELRPPAPDLGPAVPAAVALAAALVAWLSGAAGKALTLAVLPATTALPPGTVLDHPRRRDIYQAVLARPGVHLRELQRLTGIRWASLQYHIAVLAGAGMLRRTQVGRHTVLSCDVHGLNEAQLQALHALRGSRAAQVARVIAKAAPLTQADIAAATGLSPRTVNRYLRLLLELALVEAASEASRRARRYTPTPRLAQLMPELHEPRTPAGPVP